jgi:hypothetical protein
LMLFIRASHHRGAISANARIVGLAPQIFSLQRPIKAYNYSAEL